MFEDLLRDLGIEQNNSGVSCGDGERATGREQYSFDQPGDRCRTSRRPIGLDRRL